MRGLRIIAASLAALAASVAPGSASCRLTPVVAGLERALDAAAAAETAPEREAALETAGRFLAEGADGSVVVELYLMSRREALPLLAEGKAESARLRLERFDMTLVQPRLAAEATTGRCKDDDAADRAQEGDPARFGAGADLSPPAVGRQGRSGAEPLRLGPALTQTRADLIGSLLDLTSLGSLAALSLLASGVLLHRQLLRRRRREGRYLCYLPAQVSAAFTAEARLVDFSRNGARLACRGLSLDRGAEVDVEFLGIRRAAKVRWSRSGALGLRLGAPLTDEEFDAVLVSALSGAGAARR